MIIQAIRKTLYTNVEGFLYLYVMAETLSFTERGEGWDSFLSFIPDIMVDMNNAMYSFENGEIYKHHTNETRNEYYGVTYPSTITTVFNQDPTTEKLFKTVELEGNSTWQADVSTDQDTGIVELDYYKEKEGSFFSYIRRDPGTIDTTALSTQGIGLVESYSTLVITFGFNMAVAIADGDKVYIGTGSSLTLIGSIVAHDATTITLDAAAVTPAANDFIVVVKSSTAESYGVRSHFMEVVLTNSETTEVELFSVASEAFESKT